jgi:hypothetical protein
VAAIGYRSVMSPGWPELVRHPGERDHLVHAYRDTGELVDAVAEFIGTGVALGEAGIVIARTAHWAPIAAALRARGVHPGRALVVLDAERMLASLMCDGAPQWAAFEATCGAAVSRLRLQYPGVRAYGEMVDLLWEQDRRAAALELEGYWNELAHTRPFALLCAYRIDPLETSSYSEGFQQVCRAHTHLIPARDYARFNEAVDEATRRVLDRPLAQMLASLAATHRPGAEMPLGQAMLFWLKQNMPRTADKVLAQVRARLA